jgi:3-deoxy-manno-octulosonate cytidylyltransferase (CMP-KDO synthetase)
LVSAVVVIPARYGSTRFPGKPLALIGGVTMLERVVQCARKAVRGWPDVAVLVATDEARIFDFAKEKNFPVVMTPVECKTGSDRVLAAAKQLPHMPEIVVNLQGDAPFTPPAYVRQLIEALQQNPEADAATPVIRLRWEELDALRKAKQQTPFSGTTAVCDASGKALWFSKQILPALRKESDMRARGEACPVLRHIGLYAYRSAALARFVSLPESVYERLEGLEQLRMLENGMVIQAVEVMAGVRPSVSGVDAPEDIARLEAIIAAYGDPLHD